MARKNAMLSHPGITVEMAAISGRTFRAAGSSARRQEQRHQAGQISTTRRRRVLDFAAEIVICPSVEKTTCHLICTHVTGGAQAARVGWVLTFGVKTFLGTPISVAGS